MPMFAILEDTATPRLKRLAGRLQGRGRGDAFLQRWAVLVRREAVNRALAKGGRRFWKDVARSVHIVTKVGAMAVEARHRAAAQKQYGGKIEARGKGPGGARFLAIPVSPDVEGSTARRFVLGYGLDNVRFVINQRTGTGVLGLPLGGDEIDVKFALTEETKPQRPDPFFPEDDEIAAMGEDEAIRMIEE